MSDLVALESRLGHRFSDRELLSEALTHRSAGSRHNERLEFLGDALLSAVISEALFAARPEAAEGDLSRLRASLVRGESLAELAQGLRLGECLSLGSGELKSGGFRRKSILGDALEAVLGAVFLDAGYQACRSLILELFADRILNLPPVEQLKDPKTRLQERLQGQGLALPAYALVEQVGPAHARTFVAECRVGELSVSTRGEAGSRRGAEQDAARRMLERLSP